jgi:hypothetical protein
VAAVEISASEVAAVSEMTAPTEMAFAHAAKVAAATAAMTTATAHAKAATAAPSPAATFGEGVMGDRDAAKSENRHDGRNFV